MFSRNKSNWSANAGTIVRHFKGDLYLVLAIGEHTETKEKMVVYKALYEDGEIWIRPFDMFMSKVPEGKENPTGQDYRFEAYQPKRLSKYQKGD